jgi:anaerobic ribonucleoside-triphosphate reductase activating protein
VKNFESLPETTSPVLKVAATCTGTTALGPGLRSVVWVQGCPFHCPGCIAPNWIPFDGPSTEFQPEELADRLLANPQVNGLTFSGGEPFAQASALARLARLARQKRNLNIISFTGYRFETLLNTPPERGVFDLLDQLDILIDGPYIAAQNNGVGLRGSTNQRIHYLTRRLVTYDFEYMPRRMDVVVQDGEILIVGIPSSASLNALDKISSTVFGIKSQSGGNYERA